MDKLRLLLVSDTHEAIDNLEVVCNLGLEIDGIIHSGDFTNADMNDVNEHTAEFEAKIRE
jgi:predicted phosphodiesterase